MPSPHHDIAVLAQHLKPVLCPKREALRIPLVYAKLNFPIPNRLQTRGHVADDSASDAFPLLLRADHEQPDPRGFLRGIAADPVQNSDQLFPLKEADIRLVLHTLSRRKRGHVCQNAFPRRHQRMVLIKQPVSFAKRQNRVHIPLAKPSHLKGIARRFRPHIHSSTLSNSSIRTA